MKNKTGIIKDVELNKAQYHPGEMVEIKVVIELRAVLTGTYVNLEINDLDEVLFQKKYTLPDDQPGDCLQVNWLIPEDKVFNGFGLDITVCQGVRIIDSYFMGFDVVESWAQAPRYGFLASFEPEKDEKLIEERLKVMKDFHLNIVQFYDWMYRHHQLIPPTEEFKDIFDRPLSLSVVKKQIEYCREQGMFPIAYGAMYGAEKDFVAEHPDWIAGTRNGQGRNSLLDEHKEYIQIMNIAADCPWREHIINEYRKAMDKLNFAGIHIDQYGFPKTYYSIVNGQEEVKDMGIEFGNFLDYSRNELGVEAALIFNAVNDWPVEIVADRPQDVVYIEVWPPHDTFFHLRELILRARELSGFKKQVILAAYISPLNHKLDLPREAGERAARLTSAAIFASGGFHLVLGEGSTILTDPYYPEYRELSSEFTQVMKCYYETITRYSKYLFAPDLRDKSRYLTGGINGEIKIKCSGEEVSIGPDAHKDTIWTTVRENKRFKVLNLVNLMGIDIIKWDEPQYSQPEKIKNLEINWLLDEDINSVYWITPDGGDIRPKKIDFYRIEHERGEVVRFQLPGLDYWGFVVVKVD